MQKFTLWIMKKKVRKHKLSRQEEAIALFKKGFGQKEIASILGISQSTVCRYFTNPTKNEKEDFYENFAYGVYITKSGERILFNRRYKPLRDKTEFVKDIERQEWFYNDGTYWEERFFNSVNEIPFFKKKRCSECGKIVDHSNKSYPDLCYKCVYGI